MCQIGIIKKNNNTHTSMVTMATESTRCPKFSVLTYLMFLCFEGQIKKEIRVRNKIVHQSHAIHFLPQGFSLFLPKHNILHDNLHMFRVKAEKRWAAWFCGCHRISATIRWPTFIGHEPCETQLGDRPISWFRTKNPITVLIRLDHFLLKPQQDNRLRFQLANSAGLSQHVFTQDQIKFSF